MTAPADHAAGSRALHWFARLRDLPGPSAEERLAFAAWLVEDPAHAAAYAEVERTWEAAAEPAGRLAAEEAPALARLLARMDGGADPRRGGARRRAGGWWRLAAAAVCGVLLLAGLGPLLADPGAVLAGLRADHATAPGERRSVTLTDGTRIDLDAGSAIAVDFTAAERRLRLLRGRAFFAVPRDGRPFSVAVDGGEVLVLGTRFTVEDFGDEAVVTVEEGRVGIRPDHAEGRVLTPGQQVRFGASGIGGVAVVDAASALGWRDGRLSFHQMPLEDIVATLARYHDGGPLLVFGDDLRRRRVSGSFPAADPRAAVASLRSVLGFRSYEIAGAIILMP